MALLSRGPMNSPRRTFLRHSLAAGAVVGLGAVGLAQTETLAPKAPALPPESKRSEAIPLPLAKEFVVAGHGNLPKVKAMLAERPSFINASWDWGHGDFETALNGASHVGNRETALFLLGVGARVDAFAAVVLGEREIVRGLLRTAPATATTRNAHGYSLLYHVGYTGDLELAEAVAALLPVRNVDCNQTLQTATTRGHTALVAWLLEHGVDDANAKYFNGKTPLDVAIAKGYDEIARLLRARGGVTNG